MLTKFYECWKYARFATLIIAGLIALCLMIKSHSYSLEIEYTGPGSEAESLDRNVQDQKNSEAFDRYHQEGSTDPNDAKGAADYARDHGA